MITKIFDFTFNFPDTSIFTDKCLKKLVQRILKGFDLIFIYIDFALHTIDMEADFFITFIFFMANNIGCMKQWDREWSWFIMNPSFNIANIWGKQNVTKLFVYMVKCLWNTLFLLIWFKCISFPLSRLLQDYKDNLSLFIIKIFYPCSQDFIIAKNKVNCDNLSLTSCIQSSVCCRWYLRCKCCFQENGFYKLMKNENFSIQPDVKFIGFSQFSFVGKF